MSDYESILSAAEQLPLSDRLRLIDELAASVPDDHPPSLSQQWLAEIERRSNELDAGNVTTHSWQEVRRQLRRSVGLEGAD